MATDKLSTRRIDDVILIDLEGRLVLGPSAESLGNALQDAVAKGARKILLNMKAVTQVDTTGISTIVRAFVSLQRSGGKLGLFHVSERVRQILDLTRLLNVIPSFSDEAEALVKIR